MARLLKKFAVLVLVVAGLSGVMNVANAALAIIGNPANPLEGISAADVAMIYLGKSDEFPDGQKVTAVDQYRHSPVRTAFYQKVVGMSQDRLKAYWSKVIFSGKGHPPREVGGNEAVKRWVATHRDGLGYVDGKVLDHSVKVLLIVP
ncbi:MAG: phosphate ABC transporter substrate-binding protein [Gammaproteobacteria bacterium]|nr:phosphate ABC transporter substrate-binding protein [Gammaproteobacteria bacterium]